MAKVSYYDAATELLLAYLGCEPEKRIALVRDCISSTEENLDLTKTFKAIDSLFGKTEQIRGALASQLALASCTTASPTQLVLFGTTQHQAKVTMMFEKLERELDHGTR